MDVTETELASTQRPTSPEGAARGWSRRRFLGTTGALTAGALAVSAVGGCSSSVADPQSVLGGSAAGAFGAAPARRSPRGSDELLAPVAPYQLASVCELSEDYFLVQNHLIDPEKDTVVAYSRADGLVEAVVLQGGVIRQIYRDPTQPGGWASAPLTDAVDVTQMVAGVSAPVTLAHKPIGMPQLKVFYTRSGSDQLWIASQTLVPGKTPNGFGYDHVPWSTTAGQLQTTVNYDSSLLVAAMQPSKGSDTGDAQLWFYTDHFADPDQGSLTGFSYRPDRNGRWAAVGSLVPVLKPTIFLYLPGGVDDEGDEDDTVHIWTADFTDGPQQATLADDQFDGGLQLHVGGARIADVAYLTTLRSALTPTALVWSEREINGARDGNPRLWAVTWDPAQSGTRWVWTELVLPGSITSRAAAIPISTALTPRSTPTTTWDAANQLLDVFVVFDDTLHVLRQVEQATAKLDSQHPVYTPLIPLQPAVATMASQAAQSTGNELLVVGTDQVLQTLEKDPVSGRWTDAELQIPATSLQQDSAYRVTLTLTDIAWNVPVANQAVKITASTPAPATVDTPSGPVTVIVGADPVTLTTDGEGELTLALLADGLSAPTLTITADGLPQSATVYPSGAVNAYMAGDPKQKLNYLDPLSADTLKSATTPAGDTVAPGAKDPAAAKDAADTMQQAATFATQGSALGAVSSTVGRVDGGRTQLRAAHQRGANRPIRVGVHGLINDIDHWGHDALHAIKKGAVAVDHIAIDAEKKIITIAAEFTQWANNTISIVVHSIEDAAHILHAAFNKLGADIVHAVKWLEAEVVGLLRDSAAVAGHLETWLESCCGFLAAEIAAEKQAVHTWLVSQESAITKKFDAVRAGYGDKVTLANMATNPPQAFNARRPKFLRNLHTPNPGLQDADDDDQTSPHGDWFYRKVKHAITGGLLTPDLPGAGFDSMITNMATAAEGALTDFIAAFKDFFEAIESVVTQPSKAGDVGVAKLLEGVSHMLHGVFTLANAVIDTMFDLFTALAKVLTTMLTTDLGSIPIIGELFKLAGLGKMHIGSVANMIFAFPTTLAYKIAYGSRTRPFASLTSARSRPALMDQDSDLKFAAIAVMAYWSIWDTIAAGYTSAEKEPPLLIAAIDLAVPIVLTGLTAPQTRNGEPLFAAPFNPDPEDQFAFFGWLLGTLPSLTTAANIYIDHSKTLAKSAAESIRDTLAWVNAGGGVFSLIFGMMATALDDKPSGANYAVAVLNSIPPIAAPALTKQAVEASLGISAFIAMVLTASCGLGGSIAYAHT